MKMSDPIQAPDTLTLGKELLVSAGWSPVPICILDKAQNLCCGLNIQHSADNQTF